MTIFEVMICTALFCIECVIGRENIEYPHAPTPPPSPMMKHEEEIDWELVDEDDWGMMLGDKYEH